MDQTLRAVLQPTRYVAVILGTFGGVAILVAALGLYGLLRFRADQDAYGTAIRLALGAPISILIWRRMVEGLLVAMAGMAAGFVLLFLGGSVVARVEPGLTWSDPLSLLSAVIGCAGVAVLACLVPALRVLRVDPSQISRNGY